MAKIVDRIQQTEIVLNSIFDMDIHNRIEEELQKATLPIVKCCIEGFLKKELSEHINNSKAKGLSTNELYRSGFFKRNLTTLYGQIEDLCVPKLRKGNKNREWNVLSRYKCLMPVLLSKLMYLYVLGLSIRDLQESLYILNGKMLDKNTINGITLELQAKLSKMRNKPIFGSFIALIVDGVWVKISYPTEDTYIDKSGHERKVIKTYERVILAGIGIDSEGSYTLLHYKVSETESEDTWNAFFSEMNDKGLNNRDIKLVTSDGSKGILSSVNKNFPNGTLQRCIEHKAENISLYLTYKGLEDNQTPSLEEEVPILKETVKEQSIIEVEDLKINEVQNNDNGNDVAAQQLTKEEQKQSYQNQIIGHAKNIFLAEDISEAKRRLDEWTKKWNVLEPRAVSVFNKGIDRCFEFYKFDKNLHKLIRTTNLIERSFREFRTRIDEIGAFPNEIACCTLFEVTINRFHLKNQTR
jgi:putative transposase